MPMNQPAVATFSLGTTTGPSEKIKYNNYVIVPVLFLILILLSIQLLTNAVRVDRLRLTFRHVVTIHGNDTELKRRVRLQAAHVQMVLVRLMIGEQPLALSLYAVFRKEMRSGTTIAIG